MTDPQSLIRNGDQLILWNEASQKWQDVGNDFFCSQRHDGKWRVSARYGFDDGRREIEFDHQHEAMEFFVNFLASRRMRLMDQAKAARLHT